MFQIIARKNSWCRSSLFKEYSTNKASVMVTPSSSHVTRDDIHIIGEGFKPHTPLTVQSTLIYPSEFLDFQSFVYVNASKDGGFDLTETESVGGTYTGVDGMGLFWSMLKQRKSMERIQLNNGLTQLDYTFKVFKDHIVDFVNPNFELCSATCNRFVADSNSVTREFIKEGNIRGTLFTPKGSGPFPAIVTVQGGIKKGQVTEDIAALFASQGYITLALGYFGVEGVPKSYATQPLQIEYFEEAVDFLVRHNKVNADKIGTYGISKGGDIAIAMMSHLPGIKAVCSMNGCISSIATSTSYNGKITEMIEPCLENLSYLDDGTLNIRNLFNPRDQPASIHPFETSKADLLMIAGLDDYNWNSELMVDIAKERMDAVGKINYKILKYPDLGHFIDIPYMPPCDVFSHTLFPKEMLVYFGGKNKEIHTKYQALAWKDVFDFFKNSFDNI